MEFGLCGTKVGKGKGEKRWVEVRGGFVGTLRGWGYEFFEVDFLGGDWIRNKAGLREFRGWRACGKGNGVEDA
jgi:hypothetical protein